MNTNAGISQPPHAATASHSNGPQAPRISVVIPTCDRGEMLHSAIKSVENQSFSASQIIVVDNGRQAVNPESLPASVHLIRTEPRIGASKARNIGVQQSEGDYVAFLDDDDTWDPLYLESMANAVLSSPTPPDCLLGRRDILIDGDQQPRWCVREMSHIIPDVLFRNPGVGGQSTVVARDSFLRIGGFDVDLVTAEDRAIVLEFILNGYQVKCVPAAIAILTEHDGPRLTNVAPMLIGKRRFFEKYRHLMGPYEKLQNQVVLLRLWLIQKRAPRIVLLAPSLLARIAVVAKWTSASPWEKIIKI